MLGLESLKYKLLTMDTQSWLNVDVPALQQARHPLAMCWGVRPFSVPIAQDQPTCRSGLVR